MEHLQPKDRKILVNVLSDLPHFQTVRERQVIVRNALGDYPQVGKTLRFLDWNGPPLVVADNLVHLLEGQEAVRGVPALGLLALEIEPLAGAAHKEVADLRRRMRWGAEESSVSSDVWREARSTTQIVLERIIGENTLRPLYYLRRALRAADAVVRVDVRGIPRGTGFLLSQDVIMTNRHLFAKKEEIATDEIRCTQAVFFNEVPDPVGDATFHRQSEVAIPQSDKNPLVHSNKDLDFVLIRLADRAPVLSCLEIRPVVLKQTQRVAIIQHAGGYPKQISLQNNLVAYADDRVLQYYTSTKAGSSGSPVFDDEFAIVAIHTGWVHNKTWSGDGLRLTDPERVVDREYRNQGTSMVAVLNDLRAQAPLLCEELAIAEK